MRILDSLPRQVRPDLLEGRIMIVEANIRNNWIFPSKIITLESLEETVLDILPLQSCLNENLLIEHENKLSNAIQLDSKEIAKKLMNSIQVHEVNWSNMFKII